MSRHPLNCIQRVTLCNENGDFHPRKPAGSGAQAVASGAICSHCAWMASAVTVP